MKSFEFTIKGLVQGVGYRPFVARLCMQLGIKGNVCNSGGIVLLNANFENEEEAKAFVQKLYEAYPKGARPENISFAEKEYIDFKGFEIVKSNANNVIPFLPADIGICDDCIRDVTGKYNAENKTGKRFLRYPFISCAACGPRASIMERIPYDRENTTMSEFGMCPECRKDFYSQNDRRFYAQTLSCHNCGPRLFLWDDTGKEDAAEKDQLKIFNKATEMIRSGRVIAVKNVGGYHLVCDATNTTAVEYIRTIKNRETKPFAVMVKDIEAAREFAHVSAEEEEALKSPARPIVLLDLSEKESVISPEVSGNSPDIGIMLPSNGLQYMLAEEFEALVMTSANISGQPIIADDENVKKLGVPVLGNNRKIINPADDSVLRILNGKTQMLRRGRGYVPEPINLDTEHNEGPLFAAGADMKASFAIYADGRAYVSQCFGDMADMSVQAAYEQTAGLMKKMHNIETASYVCDMHPLYASTSKIKNLYRKKTENPEPKAAKMTFVQHHMAHAASVIAENRLTEPALCFSFDGTGYGTDNTIWGGELFFYSERGFTRTNHLESVRLPGGDEGSRNANLSLAGYIYEMRKRGMLEGIADEDIFCYNKLFERESEKLVFTALKLEMNSACSSSAGRLFDAASALLDIAVYNHYEGECACELEYAARKFLKTAGKTDAVTKCREAAQRYKPQSSLEIIEILVKERLLHRDKGYLALLFHELITNLMVKMSETVKTGNIVLSGGCFANRLLSELAIKAFTEQGKKVYMAHLLPPGDDGITLGQIYYAAKFGVFMH